MILQADHNKGQRNHNREDCTHSKSQNIYFTTGSMFYNWNLIRLWPYRWQEGYLRIVKPWYHYHLNERISDVNSSTAPLRCTRKATPIRFATALSSTCWLPCARLASCATFYTALIQDLFHWSAVCGTRNETSVSQPAGSQRFQSMKTTTKESIWKRKTGKDWRTVIFETDFMRERERSKERDFWNCLNETLSGVHKLSRCCGVRWLKYYPGRIMSIISVLDIYKLLTRRSDMCKMRTVSSF